MSFDRLSSRFSDSTAQTASAPPPGKRARTDSLPPREVQRSAEPAASPSAAPPTAAATFTDIDLADPFALHLTPVQRAAERAAIAAEYSATDRVHAAAARGTAEPGGALPHAAEIQRSFGNHDISHITAHVGGAAATAAKDMGAQAFATGSHVAFAAQPSLHLAAHEAAHVLQQQAGVSLKGGVGQAGDAHEQHADAVADAVVAGRSAAPLLDGFGHRGAVTSAVQRKGADAPQVGDMAGRLTEDGSALSLELARIQSAETDCLNILEKWRAGAVQTGPAMLQVTKAIRSMYEPLHAFRSAQDRANDDHDPASTAHVALAKDLAIVRAALNNAARVAMIIEPSPTTQIPLIGDLVMPVSNKFPADVLANAAQLRSAVTALATLGSDFDWSPPRNLREADAARFTFEACPTGGREERPNACNLPDHERVEFRGKISVGALKALDSFRIACAPHVATLDKMIKQQQALREKVIGKFVDGLSKAFAVATSGGAAVAVADEIGTEVAKAALIAFAGPVEGEGTRTFLDALIEAMRVHLEGVVDRVNALDDLSLRAVADQVGKLSPGSFAPPLAQLVSAYQAQIDPLGRDVGGATRFDLNLPPSTHFVFEAVKIDTARGPRLAQVAHEANTTPTDGATKGKTYHRYIFVRWIDQQFAAVVGETPTLDITLVENMSVPDILGPRAQP